MLMKTPIKETISGPQDESQPFEMSFGPLTEVHAFWLAGMSCDGCSIAAVGATQPSVESLLPSLDRCRRQ